MGREFSFWFCFALPDLLAETLERRLASGESRERLTRVARRALEGLSLAEGEAEIRSVILSPLPLSSSGLSQRPPPASHLKRLSRWTLDTSGIAVSSSDSAQVYNLQEIEITPEMIAAGVEAFMGCDMESLEPESVVNIIYLEMVRSSAKCCRNH